MQQDQRVLRFAFTVLACALLARLFSFIAEPVAAFLSQPENAAFLIYLESGRVVKPQISQPTQPEEELRQTQPTLQPEQTQPTEPSKQTVFTPEDAQLVQVSNLCDYSVDAQTLLLSQLELSVPVGEPCVLILHSHATESYTQTAEYSYTPSAAYRTLDTGCNMIRVGEALKTALEKRGLQVIHDRTLHDYPSYTDAYVNSRQAAADYLRQYPSLCLVIDLHRDASSGTNGQLNTQAQAGGKASAQLMLVVGTDANGRPHSNWEKNMTLAVKLHAQLEKQFPGICRPISLRGERFNQDLAPGALLIEVGAAGDTMEEALVAAEALAQGIAALVGL